MTQYLRNVTLWLRGFSWLWDDSRIRYKSGWGPWKFLPLYLIDHGFACLVLGLGVQPVSRWAGDRYDHQPWRWIARALNALDEGHTSEAGGLLWGSQPCRDRVRYVVMATWATIIVGDMLCLK